MSDFLLNAFRQEFTWGLLLGLLIAGFIWKSGFSKQSAQQRELKRSAGDLKELQNHLNTQLKINASGNETIQRELDTLRERNENLRVQIATIQQKPGRVELRQLHIQEIAIRLMREQAPGFAPAWEKTLRQAEADLDAADTGLKKLVRRVIPGLAANTPQNLSHSATDDPSANG